MGRVFFGHCDSNSMIAGIARGSGHGSGNLIV
jgi:hypothetical protein